MHELVEQLCHVVRVEGTQVVVSPEFCAQLKQALPEAYAVDRSVFRDLLIMWSTFEERKYQPAASQLLELLRILPQLEEEAAAIAAAERARPPVAKPKKPDGLGGKVTLGGVGMRRR